MKHTNSQMLKSVYSDLEMFEKTQTYTTIHKSMLGFRKSLFCSTKLHLFDRNYSKNSEILSQCKSSVFYMNIY